MRRVIFYEVSSLETVMRKLYFRFVTVHKSFVHLSGWKQCYARRECILSDLHTTVDHMQIWKIRYKGAPFHMPKMMKPSAVNLKACIRSKIGNYEELPQLITSLWVPHARVLRIMNVILHTHVIPSIDTLTKVKTKSEERLKLDMYFDQLICVATRAELEINKDTMHQYVIGLAVI